VAGSPGVVRNGLKYKKNFAVKIAEAVVCGR
jgi:hypothetical protein